MTIAQAVLPIAGLGVRMRPITHIIPKEFLPIYDRLLLDFTLTGLAEAGIKRLVFIASQRNESSQVYVKERANEIYDLYSAIKPKISFVNQSEQKGLGHAVLCAKNQLNEAPFLVLCPDDLLLNEKANILALVEQAEKLNGCLSIIEKVKKQETRQYGILDVAEDCGDYVQANGLIEKPEPNDAPSTQAIIGRYALPYDIFEFLNKQAPGIGGEIQLTDAMMNMLSSGYGFYGIKLKGERFDCGNRLGWFEANLHFALADDEHGAAIKEILEKKLKPLEI